MSLSAQTPASSPLLDAAGRSPYEFALMLANAEIPSGIEVRTGEDIYPRPRPAYDAPSAPSIPVGDLVAAFNAHHQEYKAELIDGVVVIRPIERRSRFLDSLSNIDRPTEIVGIMTAAQRIFSQLDSRLALPALGSTLGDSDRGENSRVVLDGRGQRRVIDTLNEIVQQFPRTWLVITVNVGEDTRAGKFGFIYKKGATVTQGVPQP